MSFAKGSLSTHGMAALAAALGMSGAPSDALAQFQPSLDRSVASPAPMSAGFVQSHRTPPSSTLIQEQQDQQRPAMGLYQTSSGATRYSTPDGSVRFIFDRSGGRAALLRFEGDPEVHVLRPTMAAGGGDLYRTDDGRLMLRVTPQGSLIIYTRALHTGAPASEEARVAPLSPQAITFAELQERFRLLQLRARRSIGQPITYTVPARMSAAAAGVVLDAAERATEGLAAAPITNVNRVIIVFGRTPAVALQGSTLLVQVAPDMGYAGRPSSNTVRNVVSGAVAGPEQ